MESEMTSMPSETRWKRLHPSSLWVNIVPQVWRTIRVLWPMLLAILFTDRPGDNSWIDLALFSVFLLVGIIRSFVHWATLRYRMDQGRLAIESGLLHRTSRIIDPLRIQNIERVQNLFHKVAGLAELRIETAGDRSTEGMLSAIHIQEAEALEAQLKSAATDFTSPDDVTEEAMPLVSQQGLTELIAYGLTNRGIGALAIIGVIAVEAMGIVGPEVAMGHSNLFSHMRFLAALLLLAFAGSFLLSVLRALHTHWKFRLTQEPGRLVTTEGLTTRRRVEIPLRKIQLIRTDEPLLRRMMGFATLHIETAGLGFVEGETPRAEGLIPMVEQAGIVDLVEKAIPQNRIDPWTSTLHPAHFRSFLRAIGLRFFRTCLLVGLVAFFAGPWALSLFAVLILAIPATWLDWRKQGWAIDQHSVVSRRGFFNRRTWLIPREKLQSVAVDQTPGMRVHGLGRVVVRVAGAQVTLPEVAIEQANAVFIELQRRPAVAQ